MKMSRRVLAIMLTVFMLVGLMPIGAFAEGGAEKEAAAEEQVPVPNEEEIQEEQPEGKTKEVPEEQPKEQPEEQPEEIPEEEPEEQTEEIPEEELEEQPEEIPEEELKEQPKEIPDEELEEQLEEIPKEQPEENPEEQPEELPEEFPPEFPMGLSLAPKGFAEANFNASSEAANAGAGEHDFYEIETQLIYKGKVANNLGEIILSSSSNGVVKKGERLYGAKNDVYLIPTIDWKVPGYRVVGTVHFAHSDGTVGGGGLNI